jgi:hypothetical protein
VPCCSGYFTGGAAVEANGGVVVHGQQLQAAARRDCSPPWCFVLLSLPLLSNVFPFYTPCLFFSAIPSPVSSFSVFFPSLLVLSAVFIGQRRVGASLSPPYCCAWGVEPSYPTTTPDEVANGCGSHGATSLVSHYEGVCVLTEHAGRERGRQN